MNLATLASNPVGSDSHRDGSWFHPDFCLPEWSPYRWIRLVDATEHRVAVLGQDHLPCYLRRWMLWNVLGAEERLGQAGRLDQGSRRQIMGQGRQEEAVARIRLN